MISIQHLEKKYENITPLRDVCAEIHKGDVISVIGPSGTGKSTLLRCINMLEKPTGGKILVGGADVTDKKTDIRKVRQKLGMVFQSFNLFSHKMVVENVMMAPMDLFGVPKQQAFDEAVEYLKMVGLGAKLYAYPDELSGGQKQRVAIARCLAMKPEVILFDEPTSALDPTMVGEVQGVIRKLAKEGLTMMVVTHDMKFSREIATRVFYMDEGILYEEGTPEAIFDHPQKEKTRTFVKRLKTFAFQVDSQDFDLYSMQTQFEEFARNSQISLRDANNTEVILEELLMNHLLKCRSEVKVEIRYYEVDSCTEISFAYGGEAYDPFREEDREDLSLRLAAGLAQSHEHCYSEGNILTLHLAQGKS